MSGELKPYTIKGPDGEPVHVPPGEYYVNTKARCRILQKNGLTNEARRVYAALELATMGFQQELAVVMRKGGKIVPLTTTDLESQTGLDRRQVRRALDELDSRGLGERRPVDPQKNLQKGNVAIYSRALPKISDSAQERGHARPPNFLSDSKERTCLIAFAKRHRLPIPDFEDARSDYIADLERVARDLQKAEEEAARILKTGTRAAAHNKEEIKRNIEEKESERASGSVAVVTKAGSAPDPPHSAARPPAITLPSKPTESQAKPQSQPAENHGAATATVRQQSTAAAAQRFSVLAAASIAARAELENWLNSHGRIGIKIDEPMLDKIATALERPELLEQFKAEALKIRNPQKYAVYEAVARQVAARGLTGPNPKAETRDEREAREFRERFRAEERRRKGIHP